MGPGLFTRVWRSELPISLGTGEFLEQGYSSKRHRLTPRCLPTPNPPNHLLATKLGTECWLHLARKPRGSSLEQMDKGTVWTHPQAFNTSNRLTNHGQQVHLDLSPGWCAVFVTEPGSLCPSFAAKMLRCQSLQQREGLFTRQPMRRLKNKSRILFPGGRGSGYLWEKEAGHLSCESSWGETIRKSCSNHGSEQA